MYALALGQFFHSPLDQFDGDKFTILVKNLLPFKLLAKPELVNFCTQPGCFFIMEKLGTTDGISICPERNITIDRSPQSPAMNRNDQ